MAVTESDAAFYSFICVMLCLFIVPSSLYTIYRVVQRPKNMLRSWPFTANVIALAISISIFVRCMHHLQDVDTSGVFDPYEILHVSDHTSLREIKKAYRQLGRILHPDKNPNNATAAAMFRRVTKAYEALTDPAGIENYRKFGHPDGPQSPLLNFAFFSAFSSTEGNSTLFVLIYFGLVFAVLAFVVYSLHRSNGRRDRTQVSNRTMSILQDSFHDKMSIHDILELLLSCDEMSSTTEEDRLQAQQRNKMHDKILKKMDASKVLPSDILTRIKKHPNAVARENMIALYHFLRRNKVAGIPRPAWINTRLERIIRELPFIVDIFAFIVAEHSVKRAYPSIALIRVLSILSCIAQGSLVPDAAALQDQIARMAKGQDLPHYTMSDVSLYVADEANVQPGDWLTLQLHLTRNHVKKGDDTPLASTFYDEVDPTIEYRKEHLWLLVIEKDSNRLYAATKIKDLSRTITHKLVFEGPGISGAYNMEIRVICPAFFNATASHVVNLQVCSK